MSGGTIVLSSITWAIRAQKLLEAQGIASNMRKISKIGKLRGCGYGLEIADHLEAAVRILDNGKIKYIDVINQV
ncbi:MAG: DUF3343 domain-containing protein [Oscillospiraceae bacterium]|nr:DUF3343 domain-containing protein [Oscillospiraceae bacterium]